MNTPRKLALRLLARREYSRHDLAIKLKIKGISTADIDAVLSQCIAEGWLSDDRYAVQLLHARVSRGYGPLRIRAELRSHGLDQEIIRTTLTSSATDWFQTAHNARRKRFGEELPDDRTARAKQVRFLTQRGFTSEHCRFALKPR